MGKVADGGDGVVVLPVVQYHGDRADGRCDPFHPLNLLPRCFLCGGDHIVGVFQQVIRRVFIAGFFGSGHGMTADKDRFHI